MKTMYNVPRMLLMDEGYGTMIRTDEDYEDYVLYTVPMTIVPGQLCNVMVQCYGTMLLRTMEQCYS